jgi:hypothetical protein
MVKTPRGEKVAAKGKGGMQTYWVAVGTSNQSTTEKNITSGGNDGVGTEDDQEGNQNYHLVACAKTARLLQWSVDVLATLLKQVHAERMTPMAHR